MSFRNKRSGKSAGRAFRVLLSCAAGFFLLWLAGRTALALIPFPQLEEFRRRPCSTRVYDREGRLVQVLALEDGLRREWYALSALPPRIAEVFIAAEDRGFYRHGGVDFGALFRAVFQNASAGRTVSGASTISMQLARMVFPRAPDAPVTVAVKAAEAWRALRIEAKLSKEEILELYLNSVPFGMQAEGIGSAARTLFGRTPAQLSDAQIHLLAVLLRRPALYNPEKNPAASYSAAMEIGKHTGFAATREEWESAVSVPARFSYPMRLPHLVNHIRQQYAAAQKRMPPELRLSADAELTETAESLVNTLLEQYRNARLSQGAVLAIDHVNGEILCWSGGNFFRGDAGQIDGVLVRNQSGSTMKPFLYALALEHGFLPASVLADIPMDFGSSQAYVPLNFNNRYNGPVLLRTALASSLNIPAVYLLWRLGVDNFMQTLAELGFASLAQERERTGLSLALGSGEVTLLELTRAFSVFARAGSLPELSYTLLPGGSTAPPAVQVFEPDTAAILCDMLSDGRARALGFGFAEVFRPPYPAIFKTGTSNQFQNILALGSTARYTAGVWMGNFTGETVIRETGSSIPARVVRALLDALTERYPESARPFPQPHLFRKVPVCALSGMAPGAYCPAVTEEFAPVGSASSRPLCSWHVLQNGTVQVRYPAEYQRWLSGKNDAGSLAPASSLRILYPADGAAFVFDPSIPPESQMLRVDAAGPGRSAVLLVNGTPLETVAPPFFWYVPLVQGDMHLEVRTEYPAAAASVTVTVQ